MIVPPEKTIPSFFLSHQVIHCQMNHLIPMQHDKIMLWLRVNNLLHFIVPLIHYRVDYIYTIANSFVGKSRVHRQSKMNTQTQTVCHHTDNVVKSPNKLHDTSTHTVDTAMEPTYHLSQYSSCSNHKSLPLELLLLSLHFIDF